MEVASIRGELEIVQKALKLQTRRCRQLVEEYTKRLQEKEQQYQSERMLRDDQLAKVLRALLVFEARLRQEQKNITHQLLEKDFIIKRQCNEIDKLMANQYCKHCNQYYSPMLGSNIENVDSSSDYVATDYQDYQSSNFESLDSSSETYATISEKDYSRKSTSTSELSFSGEDRASDGSNVVKMGFLKGKNNKECVGRRGRKFGHRKSVGTYFEVLKSRNESPTSNEDNTSIDYENLDSLTSENVHEKIEEVQERIEVTFESNNVHQKMDNSIISISSTNETESDCNDTVIQNCEHEKHVDCKNRTQDPHAQVEELLEAPLCEEISDSVTVFEDGEANDKWYASGSDQEDEGQRDIYRNNPVLECMNQILLHNINDSISSPPKTPNVERKFNKNTKRVKFSDEEEAAVQEVTKTLNAEVLESKLVVQNDYYETPIQKAPNFYETPQSIYSNDYEQISSKASDSLATTSPTKKDNLREKEINILSAKKLSLVKNVEFDNKNSHYYDMDTKNNNGNKFVRKSKILRTPPALPPKPVNLVSKYKLQTFQANANVLNEPSIESEPDYCSISELNIPTKSQIGQKINVVAEINTPNINDVTKEMDKHVIIHKVGQNDSNLHNDPTVVENDPNCEPAVAEENVNTLISKNIEKFTIQLAKQTQIKSENTPKQKLRVETEIPKLPQVSEIIIPEEEEGPKKSDEHIAQDNYIKNNSQMLKHKSTRSEGLRRPIVIGSSVSSLITGFNNQQLLSEIQKKPLKTVNKLMFSGFDTAQNADKHSGPDKPQVSPPKPLNFDQFDLSQNFEEFKLEDCDIGEEYDIENKSDLTSSSNEKTNVEEHKMPDILKSPKKSTTNSTRVELVRATNSLTMSPLKTNHILQLQKRLEFQRSSEGNADKAGCNSENVKKDQNEPTYEHFLECTGLSSKSILTPSRLLSNHKSVLKPKDVKLRSKVKSNGIFERNGSTIKYWSEPYI